LQPGGPVTAEDRAARQSTSAQLRQTQAALAASQADLTRVEAELAAAVQDRDYLRVLLDDQQAELSTELLIANAELRATQACTAGFRRSAEDLAAERDKLAAQVEDFWARLGAGQLMIEGLRRQLAAEQAARSWQVAKQDTGHACSLCSQPIVRGQAFQPLADAKGFFAHCACPEKESSDG
jgi:DNA repair exonuclease SbcCD ATPase subunit